jgi:hypothetical protein
VFADLGLVQSIATFKDGEDMMVQFPVRLTREPEATTIFMVGGHNPLGTRGIAGTFWYTAPEVLDINGTHLVWVIGQLGLFTKSLYLGM